MICKKCGCDALIKDGDWYKCPNCGAEMFDTEVTVNNIKSPTKAVEEIDGDLPNRKSDSFTPDSKETVSENQNADTLDVSTENDDEVSKKKKGRKNKKNKKENEIKEPKSKLRDAVDFCIPIVIAVIVAILLKTFVFANAVVPTGSMLNTIQLNDRIIASRLAYINDDPERYDVIIFKYPDDEEQCFVKRVIGLPGETVEIVSGVVYVTKTDGTTIQLDDSFVTNCEPYGDFGPYEVPEDCYFVLGDNRNDSWDSRYWTNTYVEKDKILGKVLFRYYPSITKIE
ncbi:MAG: signal peptidase I [Clostridiales bacterium]|nr:signal peptidase I [Clostridiales bacterium]